MYPKHEASDTWRIWLMNFAPFEQNDEVNKTQGYR